ncbi:type II toxin-antitoxin system HicB family antitoxin (plasmid) [Psychrobium sp. nBUS_13]|uniref:type II toxin-antitoxin system HicB family antitoxin n=1 Tax=Psychrobium sp. nBUS_13 TaxID=3395319 RepID=UPI003EBA7BA8
MLFMVGIEPATNDNEAHGIIVPVFEKLGYGCYSAADEREEILFKAKEVILLMAEEVINDGHLIESLDEGYTDYQSQHEDFTQWLAIDVPVSALKGKQKRINITLAEPFLERVDTYVEFHNEFKDRSDFLAKAADNLMQKSA